MMNRLPTLDEMLEPKLQGYVLNANIIQGVQEPTPDYEAMRLLCPAPASVATSLPVSPGGQELLDWRVQVAERVPSPWKTDTKQAKNVGVMDRFKSRVRLSLQLWTGFGLPPVPSCGDLSSQTRAERQEMWELVASSQLRKKGVDPFTGTYIALPVVIVFLVTIGATAALASYLADLTGMVTGIGILILAMISLPSFMVMSFLAYERGVSLRWCKRLARLAPFLEGRLQGNALRSVVLKATMVPNATLFALSVEVMGRLGPSDSLRMSRLVSSMQSAIDSGIGNFRVDGETEELLARVCESYDRTVTLSS